MSIKFKKESELAEFTKTLIGKKAKAIYNPERLGNYLKNKGLMGQIVERDFFGYELNNKSLPDFEEIGVELKVSPLKKMKSKKLTPKERIKITIVNHEDILNHEDIKESKTWSKLRKLLIIWYINETDWLENKFDSFNIFNLEESDFFEELRKDWITIRSYLIKGEMHLLSESSTNFLGVVRCGSGKNEKMIAQPNSDEKYFKRAIALKISFVKLLYNSEKIRYKNDFLENLNNKVKGKNLSYMLKQINEKFNYKDKSQFQRVLCKNIAGVSRMNSLTDFVLEEYGEYYTFKTVTLNYDENGDFNMKESFKINVNLQKEVEKEWEDSKFSQVFENDFILFLISHSKITPEVSNIKNIIKLKFNDKEIKSVKFAFEEYKDKYFNGGLVNDNKNVNIIKASDKSVVHFRPSSLNKDDTFFTPAGEEVKKTALWFNNDIILSKIKEKLNE